MWGAVIGDLAGSIYEYEQIKGVKKVESKEIIPDNAFYSDDTILTIAVLDAIMHDKDYEKYLKLYGNKYSTFKPNIEPYFEKVSYEIAGGKDVTAVGQPGKYAQEGYVMCTGKMNEKKVIYIIPEIDKTKESV